MSNTYGAPPVSNSAAPLGGSLTDLVSTQKGGVQNLANIVAAIASALPPAILSSLSNAFPPATTTASPKATAINTLGTTGTSVIAASSSRHGIIFHNPATTSVNLYIYPSAMATAPTLASTAGAFLILPGADLPFPSTQFPNVNCAFSAFAGTGSNQQLTIWEFF